MRGGDNNQERGVRDEEKWELKGKLRRKRKRRRRVGEREFERGRIARKKRSSGRKGFWRERKRRKRNKRRVGIVISKEKKKVISMCVGIGAIQRQEQAI